MTADAVGGVWTYAFELARALEERGVAVVVASMGPRPGPEQRAALGARLVESEFALEWTADPWEDVERAGEWLLRLEREVEADVVHLNGYVHGALDWRAPTVIVGHSCVLSWWQAVRHEAAPPEWDRYAQEVERGLAAVDAVVAPTRWMLGELERLYGLEGDRRVVPNGRAAGPAAAKEAVVAAVGRFWDEAKNLAALRRVAPRLDWPLRVPAEDGRAAPGEVADLLARASIFAAPARYEPFGLSALEAGLVGCALVLGDTPSLREVWADAALFVDPQDDAALELALRQLIEDASLRVLLARRAQARASAYTPRRMAEGYLEVYRAVRARAKAA
jgi:glycogen synthase